MGTWIAHLRIAENLLGVLPGLDEAAFACGNLAPDSGAPNADWSAFDPPKEVTHFLKPGEDEGRIKDLEFYRAHLVDATLNTDPIPYSFLLGYFFHLLCDNLWSKRIVATCKIEFAENLAQRGLQAWWDLKEDWYDLDRRYIRDHPNSLFWRVLMGAPNPQAYLSFLSAPLLRQQLDYIRAYYSQPDPSRALDRAYPFLSEATMTRFVDDCTSTLIKAYAHLRDRGAHIAGHSALAILTEREIAPYDPPLGDPG